MSQVNREKAVDIIAFGIQQGHSANYILNQLMRAGFTNDNIIVHIDEVRHELDTAVFIKCRMLDEDDGDSD